MRRVVASPTQRVTTDSAEASVPRRDAFPAAADGAAPFFHAAVAEVTFAKDRAACDADVSLRRPVLRMTQGHARAMSTCVVGVDRSAKRDVAACLRRRDVGPATARVAKVLDVLARRRLRGWDGLAAACTAVRRHCDLEGGGARRSLVAAAARPHGQS